MYKWDAKDYHLNSSCQFGFAQELIGKLNLQGTEAVLDIGSGDGKITAQIAGLVPKGRVVGIDASPDMVAFAKENFPPAKFPNLSFTQMDAREISFENQFDLVFSNATLHWVIGHEPVLKGIHDALKPGGRMKVQMGGKGNASWIAQAVVKAIQDPKWVKCFSGFKSPWGFYEPGPYRKWVEDSGLKPVRVELFKRTMTQKGSNGLKSWIRTTWHPFLDCVPQEQRDEFIDRIVANFFSAHPLDPSGDIQVEMVRLEVEAVK
jgi:trans-aconitate 2-methyltransferase